MEHRPQILANLANLGPVYVVLEIVNVGTLAAKNVRFTYYVKEGSEEKRTLYQPLLKVNESKVVLLQNSDGKQIGNIDYVKSNKTVLVTKSQFSNVLNGEEYSTEQEINISEYAQQLDKIAIQWKEEPNQERNRELEKLSRSVSNIERQLQKIEQETHNQLNVNRLIIQKEMLFYQLQDQIKNKKSLQAIQHKVHELFLILMDPYPDMKNNEIQQILNAIKKQNKISYEAIWKFFPSLKWSKVEK